MSDTPKCPECGDPECKHPLHVGAPVSPAATPRGMDFEKARKAAEVISEFGASNLTHEPYCQAPRSVESVCTCGAIEDACNEEFQSNLQAQHRALCDAAVRQARAEEREGTLLERTMIYEAGASDARLEYVPLLAAVREFQRIHREMSKLSMMFPQNPDVQAYHAAVAALAALPLPEGDR